MALGPLGLRAKGSAMPGISHSSRLRRATAVAGGAALALTGVVASGPAGAAPATGDPTCPLAAPLDQVVAGQAVDGLTVSQGTTPEPFTGEVIGVVEDSVAPGVDMILAELTSPAIDRVGGIWAGMSGSPVYVEDSAGERRLLGAVAYSLTMGPSPVAGITPATEMYRLLDGGAARASAEAVALPRGLARAVVKSGAATRAETRAGLAPLALPLGLSGLRPGREELIQKKLGLANAHLYRVGAAAADAPGDPATIVPGGNVAASWAYGEFSAIAAGTVTAVCGQEVLAFGHPMSLAGATTMTMHSADAVHVLKDPIGTGTKLVNPTGAVGTIDQDRLAAIKGLLGVLPETALITTDITAVDTGFSREGETHVSAPKMLADAVMGAVLVGQDRVFDRIGDGSSYTTWTIGGTADGEPFSVQRSNRYSSEFDISVESVFEIVDMVQTVQKSRLAEVEIDTVGVTTELSASPRQSRVGQVEIRDGRAWRVLEAKEKLRAQVGSVLKLRVTLRQQAGDRVQKKLAVTIPKKATPGARGTLQVLGGQRLMWGGGNTKKPADFEALLDQLAQAPRNDQLFAALDIAAGRSSWTRRPAVLADEVIKGQQSFKVRVTR